MSQALAIFITLLGGILIGIFFWTYLNLFSEIRPKGLAIIIDCLLSAVLAFVWGYLAGGMLN